MSAAVDGALLSCTKILLNYLVITLALPEDSTGPLGATCNKLQVQTYCKKIEDHFVKNNL